MKLQVPVKRLQTAHDLTTRALLVDVSVSLWQARKLDKEETRAVKAKYGITRDITKVVNTALTPEESREYARVLTAGGKIRTVHYAHTLPWAQDGRIVSTAKYDEWADAIRTAFDEFDSALAEFYPVYPALVQNAKLIRNGMWKASDYPSESALRRKFKRSCASLPLPTANDFRVQMDSDTVTAMQKELEEWYSEGLANITEEVIERLKKALTAIYDNISREDFGGKKTCRDSIFTNLAELCETLPALNPANSPKVSKLIEDIRTSVNPTPQTAEACRKNPAARAETARAVSDILQKMGGL